jgi:hypothetical protein
MIVSSRNALLPAVTKASRYCQQIHYYYFGRAGEYHPKHMLAHMDTSAKPQEDEGDNEATPTVTPSSKTLILGPALEFATRNYTWRWDAELNIGVCDESAHLLFR